jgi:hypothetical protein
MWMTGGDYEFEHLYLDALLEMADHDVPPVFHIWWSANGMFPDKSMSERLSLSERVMRKLLDEGLVDLVRSGEDAIPPGEWNDIPRQFLHMGSAPGKRRDNVFPDYESRA